MAYGLPKASITRLKKGNLNLSKVQGEISWKKKLFFKEEYNEDLHLTISKLIDQLSHNQRFLIVTDYKTLLAIDTKTNDKLDIPLTDLPKHYDFFLPWAGMEKAQHTDENPADVRAAVKMAKLFDVIKNDNPDDAPEFIHGLNVFLSRLLFCFFAEDTHIFEQSQFTNAIDSHTQKDGSDLNTYLDTLFTVLNTPEKERKTLSEGHAERSRSERRHAERSRSTEVPEYLNAFPYVNGGLFEQEQQTPVFTRRSRQAILDSGDQGWSAINPDIFGSMFQAVIGAEQRGSLGQHYTSVPNIMKVIEPLFLNELYEEFEKAKGNLKKLKALLNRIHNIKIFDPACGSGNFLIIAYKELRILEMKILKELKTLGGTLGSGSLDFGNDYLSHISLSNFYGIEIDDFAHEIAKLALWLAEHQMNVEFFKEFGRTNPTLPLKDAGQIVQGNATRLDWEEVCPKNEGEAGTERSRSEVYILGNPPYLGAHLQSKEQKEDIVFVFKGIKAFKKLDYIACWIYKGARYIKGGNCHIALVSTNSICQGEQVGILWPNIINETTHITFAYQSFLWTNNAKSKAAVFCIIVGLSDSGKKQKLIYTKEHLLTVDNISPYLLNGNNTIISARTNSISALPKMIRGSSPVDGGNLILNEEENENLLRQYPQAKKYIKLLVGADDFLNGKDRWCLWLTKDNIKQAIEIPEIKKRITLVKAFRLKSKKKATQMAAKFPYRFFEPKHIDGNSIIIPRVTSERRKYLQCGFLDSKSIVLDRAQVIYNSEPFVFGILSSKIHHIWATVVSGRLKMDLNYSVSLTYNNFPFPPISTQRKNEITQAVFRILEEREKHSGKTLAQLYDPDKMPDGLREAHRQNDEIIEKCYRSTPFKSDEERLEYLFKRYEKMIAEEKEQGTLFAKEKKTRKRKKA